MAAAPLFALGFLLLRLQLSSHEHRLVHGDGQHQPQAARPFWLAHLTVLPMKPTPLAVFVLILDPKAQLIPRRFSVAGRQIAHHTDGLLIAPFPADPACALHLLAFLTPAAWSFPLSAHPLDMCADGLKAAFSFRLKRQRLFDAQEGMPSLGLDGAKEPGRIQPAVGHRSGRRLDVHPALGWHRLG